jgi:alkylhydroperoxidase family enzyme
MTWLRVSLDSASDRDGVLGLHPGAYTRHRAFLQACDAVTDRDLLELCRARMAQMLRCREELARHSPELLARLQSWYEDPSFSQLQRETLAFVEQFVLDPSSVSRGLVAPLERELGTSGVINFTTVISAYEASLRLSTLLDLEPSA